MITTKVNTQIILVPVLGIVILCFIVYAGFKLRAFYFNQLASGPPELWEIDDYNRFGELTDAGDFIVFEGSIPSPKLVE